MAVLLHSNPLQPACGGYIRTLTVITLSNVESAFDMVKRKWREMLSFLFVIL